MKSHYRARALLALAAGVLLAAIVSTPLAAQAGIVEGTVTDEQQRALAGVQVMIVGTQRGTITGGDGTYRVTGVPAGSREVRAQRIGYRTETQQIQVSPETTVAANFVLTQSVIDIGEVVVTGVAGATARANLPFTVERLDAARMPVPAVSAGAAIQGKVAGAQVVQGSGRPGAAPSILLRGPTSIDATGRTQDPLYIVDGVILGASLVDIDALDIDNIEVVKGAAAASLYGSRAANGVVQITTRTGSGLQDDVTRFSMRTEYGRSELATMIETARYHRFRLNEAGTAFVTAGGVEFDWTEEVIRDSEAGFARGGLRPTLAGTNIWNTYQEHEWPGQTFNHVERFFNPGDFVQAQLSAEGRSGATNWHASVSHLGEEGVMWNQPGFDRQTFRLNLDQGVGDNALISARTSYSRSTQGGWTEAAGNPLFNLTRMPAGIDLETTYERDGRQEFVIRPDHNNENANPLEELLKRDRTDDRERFLGGVNLRYSLTDWFDLDGNVSYDLSNVTRNDFYPRGFQTARASTQLNQGYVYRDGWTNEALNTSLTGTFRYNLGPLNARSQLRYLYEAEDYSYFRASGANLVTEGVTSVTAAQDQRITRSTDEAIRSEGIFGITNLNFQDRYILDLLVRRDGSSLFGPENRWHTYGRAAAAWRVSQEPWFNVAPFNELKLRYSIGSAGGRPNFAAQYETYTVLDGSISPQNLGNLALAPEFVIENEVGLETIFLDRFALDVTYAHSEARDQILRVPLPAVSGFLSQWQNAGTLRSNTIEASFDAAIIQTPDLSWNARLLFDRTRQRISALNVPEYQYGYPFVQGLERVYVAREGEALGTFYGLRWATTCGDLPAAAQAHCEQFQVNDDGYLVWVGEGGDWRNHKWGESTFIGPNFFQWGTVIASQDGDGNTLQRIGSTQPGYSVSLGNTLAWRGFTFYGLLDAVQDVNVYNLPRHWATFQNYNPEADQAPGTPEESRKPIGYYASLYGGLSPTNSHFVEDGSFVKLRELSLRYRFGAEQLAAVPGLRAFDGVGLSLVGRNLFTWTNYTGFDPEVGFGGGDVGSAALARFDGFSYPNFRTWTAAIEVNF